jgi:4-amino-4-deoxy-L-arabinose transferase-like glycosyltransferase
MRRKLGGDTPSRPVEPAQAGTDRLWLGLAAILLLAVLVRLPGLLAGLWHDEAMYSRVYFDDPARRDWLLWKDVHPPAYPLLLWLWSSLFGNHETVLRLPSFLAGLASLVIVWKLARQLFGGRVAVLATTLLALSPPHIWYSVENKANMLALCLSVLALLLFVRAAGSRAGWGTSIAAAASLVGALLTHSYAVATGATLVVWLGLRAWREREPRGPFLLAGGVLLLGWLPLFLWKVSLQGMSLARPYLRPLDMGELYKLLLVWFPHGNTIRSISPYSRFAQLFEQPWPYVLVDAAAAFVLALGLGTSLRAATARTTPGTEVSNPWPHRLLLLWFVPPLVAGVVISLFVHRFYIERNFILLLPAFALLVAVGVDHVRDRRRRWAAGALVAVLALAGVVALLFVRREQWTVYKPKPDWRGAARWLRAEAAGRGSLGVVLTTPSLEAEFYLPSGRAEKPSVSVTDYCRLRQSPLVLARQGGGAFWLVKNETWLGCWPEAWQHAAGTAGVVPGRERRFSNLILQEFVAR